MNIYPQNHHESWNGFLDEKINKEILEISEKIGHNINPEPQDVLRFMDNDLADVKVVILGQDPYPQKGRATGRCFEVGDLTSWNDKFRQVSLKNIVRLLHKDSRKADNYEDIRKFSEIQKEISNEEFKILPPTEIFKSWEKQGVLLLNTYFTVESGVPGSHIKIWENFSNELLQYISTENKDITWFLWGKQAQRRKPYIKYGNFCESRHPMMCSSKYDDDFLKSRCFRDTWDTIKWT